MTSWHVALLGGYRWRGTDPLPAKTVLVTAIGGMDVDLRTAPIPAAGAELVKVSLIGGVHVTVPADVPVRVDRFFLFGSRKYVGGEAPADATGPPLRVRAFGIVGGVRVERA